MPVVDRPSHAHRYSSYLLQLKGHWSHKSNVPGRNKAEKKFVSLGVTANVETMGGHVETTLTEKK